MSEPRRIYGWLDSHLSIARHSGGCIINGVKYRIAYAEEGEPLVEVVPKPRKARATKPAPDPLRDLLDGL